ncbi:MAG: T9SS type A sorting domain-containing protein, partial [Calditrichales bacterium]
YIITFILIFVLLNGLFAQSKGGRWQFENNGEDTADWDTANNIGTLIDSAAYSEEAPLQEGAAYLWLDSTQTYNFMKIEDSGDLDFTDENIAISAWIYPVVLNTAHFFITKGVQNVNPKTTNYALRISKSQNLEFLIRDANNQAHTVASSFIIPLNQWTFVAAFYDFGAQKLYMWNEPVENPADTLDFSLNFFANDGPLAIGAWYVDNESAPSTANFKGRIDDVRISGRLDDVIPGITAIGLSESRMPGSFQLDQNYPNPFNPETVISFYLPKKSTVSLKIYNNRGQLVESTSLQDLQSGKHHFTWNGSRYASGIYYYQLKTELDTATKRMLLIR